MQVRVCVPFSAETGEGAHLSGDDSREWTSGVNHWSQIQQKARDQVIGATCIIRPLSFDWK